MKNREISGRPPLVSVLVTTYNQADTIGETLDSIISQEREFDLEIEVSDDCSTDDTPQVCLKYAEAYPGIIRFHRNKRNIGARANYFATLMRCRGTYIADLAGDDRWTRSDKLSRQVEALESNPEIVLSHTDWQYTDALTRRTNPSGNRNDSPELQPIVNGKDLIVPLLNADDHMAVHSCTSVFRADVAKEIVTKNPRWFNNPAYPCEDLQFLCLIVTAGKVHYINEVMMDYRISDNQLTSASDTNKAFNFNYGTLKLRCDLKDYFGLTYDEVPNIINHAAFVAGLARKARSLQLLEKAMKFYKQRNLKLPLRSQLRNLLFYLTGR